MGKLKALCIKNWIIFRTNWAVSIFQFLLPISLALILLVIGLTITQTEIPETNYIQNPTSDLFVDLSLTNEATDKKLTSCSGRIGLFPLDNVLIVQIKNYLKMRIQQSKKDQNKSVEDKQLFQQFKNQEEMFQYIRSQNYGSQGKQTLCYAISVNQSTDDKYSYQIWSNQDTPSTQFITNLDKRVDNASLALYAKVFLPLQVMINQQILKLTSGRTTFDSVNPVVFPIKEKQFTLRSVQALRRTAYVFLIFPLMVIFLRQNYYMIHQKELKIKQAMRIMGMSNILFLLSYVIRYFITYLIVAFIQVGIYVSLVPTANYLLLLIMFLLFDILLIIQAAFFSIFFTKAKIGASLSSFLFSAQLFTHIALSNNKLSRQADFYPASISAHASLSFALNSFTYAYSQGIQVGFAEVSTVFNNYAISTYFISVSVNIVVFLLLTLYLEEVWPNDFGRKRHPLFCFKGLWHKQEKKQQKMMVEYQQNCQELDENFHNKPMKDKIILNNLTKQLFYYRTFDNGKQAVKKLNLTFYKDHITAFLGHNGAGKSTTLSMLIGMLQPSSGSASIYGYDIQNDMESIRNFMGICFQHDTLYEDLTVLQHLEMFAVYKNSDNPTEEALKLTKDVNLMDKKDQKCVNLSGGQKRRLSVAIAFIGKSDVIFLDEPTTGMDTSARRYIWQMIKNYKKNRSIILTTHYMDQADFLGDRIAIIGDGQLMTCGSSLFLKNKYGVGYNLSVSKQSGQIDSNPIIKLVLNCIPNAAIISNLGSQLSLQLPMESIQHFSNMFNQLDDSKQKLGIQSYGISITTLEQVFLNIVQPTQDKNDEQIEKSVLQKNQEQKIDKFTLQQSRIQGWKAITLQLKAVILKRLRCFYRDPKSIFYQMIIPLIIVIFCMVLSNINFIKDDPSLLINSNLYQSYTTYYDIPAQYKIDGEQLSASSVTQFDSQLYSKKQEAIYGVYMQTTSYPYKPYIMVKTNLPHSSPLAINEVYESIISKQNGKSVSIKITNSPFPKDGDEIKLQSFIAGIIGSLMHGYALAFVVSNMIIFMVNQKKNGSKNLQQVSGINLFSYWLGNYIIDLTLYTIIAILCIVVIYIFNLQFYITSQRIDAMWILFILYGVTNILCTYVLSFFFQDYSTAESIIYLGNWVLGSLLPGVFLILRFFLTGDTRDIFVKLEWVFRLIPAFAFGNGIVNAITKQQNFFEQDKSIWNINIILGDVIFLICGAVVFPFLIFGIEKIKKSKMWIQFNKPAEVNQIQTQLDEDVQKERQNINQSKPQDYAVYSKNISKIYPTGKQAVNKLSFGIKTGEIFGLLGINGAGKTTTFKMLEGQEIPTSGQAFIRNINLNSDISDIRKIIGYCPQFDSLIDNLTVQEHLQMFSDIKGIPSDIKDNMIKKMITDMQLAKYKNTLSVQLSGGNKRKLSVGIALLGNPPIIFLDEPSTGIDPAARRFMWNLIQNISTKKKQSSIILTTHSMQQAQALSSRIGIMVNGNFKCIGSIQHIKSKFGKGYQLQVKFNILENQQAIVRLNKLGINPNQVFESVEAVEETCKIFKLQKLFLELKKTMNIQNQMKNGDLAKTIALNAMSIEQGNYLLDFIRKQFGQAELIQNFLTYYRIRIMGKERIGNIFGVMQKNKASLNIQQYSVKQATVQQIFNKFAQNAQIED